MNKVFPYLLIKILLVGILLFGLILVLASFQTFENLSSLLDHLAADGKLEAFNMVIYQTLRLPILLAGSCLAALSGFMLIQWKKTSGWIQKSPTLSKLFLKRFKEDTKSFVADAKVALMGVGWTETVIVLGIMLAALFVRLANIDIPLTHDEAYMYNAFASRSFEHIISNYHLPNNHVLLSLLIKVTTDIFGNHVWALRLPTIIAGVLMIPAAYWFAKGQYSRETATLAALLVAVFPILVEYSVLSRGYAIISLITLLLFILGFYVIKKKNRFAWLLVAFLSALGFFTIPIMLFPFGALYIWLLSSFLIRETRSYDSKLNFLLYWVSSGISAALLTILLYMPILINNFDSFLGNNFIAPLEWDVFPTIMWVRVRNTWLIWTDMFPWWLSLLGALGFFISLIFHKKLSKQKFPVQFAFILWILTLIVARRPDMEPRLWVFLAAPLLVWSAAGIVEPLKLLSIPFKKGWNLAQITVGFIFALVVGQSLLVLPSIPKHWNGKDGLEQITIFLKDKVEQDTLVTASMPYLPPLRYYFNFHDVQKGTIRESGKFQHAYVILDRDSFETLDGVAPKLGFDIPAVNMDTAKIVYEFENYTVYECEPLP